MRLFSRMDGAPLDGKLNLLKIHTNIVLAVVIMIVVSQAFLGIFLCMIWRKNQPSRQTTDLERGLELGNVSRNIPRSTQPQAPPIPSPIAPTPYEARGRPVAAYTRDAVDDAYSPGPSSRDVPRPQMAPRDITRGISHQQTFGTDYSKSRRENRFDVGDRGLGYTNGRTNTNDADYGKKGNRFAHGT